MAYEINNVKRGTSTIRVVGAGSVTTTLNNLSVNTDLEVVSSASIKRINWSAAPSGNVIIARGATPNTIYELYGSGEIRLDEWGSPSANGSTGNVVITIYGGGTCTLELSKQATYISNLDG